MEFKNSKLNQKTRFKKKQFEQFPFCPRCGVRMILKNFGQHGKIPDNLVTLEHVFSRNPHEIKMRQRFHKTGVHDHNRRWMILCWKCNREKGIEENMKTPRLIQWIKSRHFPYWLDILNYLIKPFVRIWFTQADIKRMKEERIKRKLAKEMQEYISSIK